MRYVRFGLRLDVDWPVRPFAATALSSGCLAWRMAVFFYRRNRISMPNLLDYRQIGEIDACLDRAPWPTPAKAPGAYAIRIFFYLNKVN